MPVRADIFEAWLSRYRAEEEYTDEFGNEIYPVNGGGFMEGMDFESKPLTKEDEEIFRELLSRTGRSLWIDSSLQDIIQEEAEGYFAGDKKLDDVCSVIQNRVTTYVNENK